MPGLLICLSILLVRHAFEDASGSRCVKSSEHGTAVYARVTQRSEYAWICLKNTLKAFGDFKNKQQKCMR